MSAAIEMACTEPHTDGYRFASARFTAIKEATTLCWFLATLRFVPGHEATDEVYKYRLPSEVHVDCLLKYM